MHIPSNGLLYNIDVQGEGEPLVLLHGFTGSVETWDEITPELAQQFRVIAVDLPGHGQTETPSDPARCSMQAVTEDLVTILTAIDAKPVHLVGYSMGARLALFVALRHPELCRTLYMVSGSPGLKTEAERAARRADDEELVEKIEKQGLSAFVEQWERMELWISQNQLPSHKRERLRAQRLKCKASGLVASLRGMGTGVQPSLWEKLPTLQVPVEFITGTLDTKFTAIAQEMYSLVPGTRRRLAHISNAGHTPYLEQPAAFVDRIISDHWKLAQLSHS